MKTIIFQIAAILFLGTASVFAGNTVTEGHDKNNETQITFKGKVIDKNNGEALAGALISVEGTNIKVFSDLDGNFNFSIKPGIYNLEIDYISYGKNNVKNYAVDNTNNILVFQLEGK